MRLNRHHYEKADLVACAAAFAYHLTQAHAFVDGNKRIAAAMMETFLESNVQLFLNIASGPLSRDQVELQLRAKVSF